MSAAPSSPPARRTRKTAPKIDDALASHRSAIDSLTRELVVLLNRRTGVCLKVGELKQAAGRPLYAPAREAEVLRLVRSGATGPLSPAALSRIFRTIIDETLAAERRLPKLRR